jgi:hypothetical protein
VLISEAFISATIYRYASASLRAHPQNQIRLMSWNIGQVPLIFLPSSARSITLGRSEGRQIIAFGVPVKQSL